LSRRPRAVVINNDDPASDYGARHLAAAFEPAFETAIQSPIGGLADPRRWLDEQRADALVLSGSERSVTEDLPWMREEAELLRSAVDRGTPILAICFGHQLLARAFGGPIVTGEKHIGLFEIEPIGADPVFAGAGERLVVPQQHADQVGAVPVDFELIATSGYCPIQAIRLAGTFVYGMQFHPCYEADVFGADEEWGELGFEGPFVHDGALVLGNASRLFAEHLR
jgi:GMP synthase-like glutamine amidotransferase